MLSLGDAVIWDTLRSNCEQQRKRSILVESMSIDVRPIYTSLQLVIELGNINKGMNHNTDGIYPSNTTSCTRTSYMPRPQQGSV
ncbi:hypothetical protein BLOT_005874 [Blomia tropicalis]|nr:hypothetical protein BLOT_005874 [Blomia tropicalis]